MGTVDVGVIVTFHDRIKRTAKLAGIILPKEKSRYSSDSDDTDSLSDCSSTYSYRSPSRSLGPPPPPPPPPGPRQPFVPSTVQPQSTVAESMSLPVSSVQPPFPPPPPGFAYGPPFQARFTPQGMPIPPPPPPITGPLSSQIQKDAVSDLAYHSPILRNLLDQINPPSYTESPVKSESVISTSLPELGEKKDISKSNNTSKKDESESEGESAGITKYVAIAHLAWSRSLTLFRPAVLEPRLFKSKPTGLTFKIRTMFRSKESLAEEMRKALSDTDSHLLAFVIQGSSQNAIPHSAFHSLETTHMRTILSQLGDDTWCKTFTSLNPVEHSALGRVIRPFAHGKFHDREVLVLKVIKEEPKITAWTALLRDIRRGSAYSSATYRDGRILLAIVREQLVDGKPLNAGAGPGFPGPPPPLPLARQYQPPGFFRPGPPPLGPPPLHSSTTISDLRSHMLPARGLGPYSLNDPPPPPPPAQHWPPPPPGAPPPPPARNIYGPAINTPGSSIRTSDITPVVTNQEATIALTTYKEYTMRRCQPDSSDKPATWLRVNTTLESSGWEVVKSCVSKFESNGGNVLLAKLKLTDDQSAQVARVMDSISAMERDMRFEWCWAVIALLNGSGEIINATSNAFISVNTHTIHLIAKRSLKSPCRPLDVYNSMIRIAPPLPGPGPSKIFPPPPLNAPVITLGPKRTVSLKSESDSGSDTSTGYVRRHMRKVKTRGRRKGAVKWVRDKYVRELSRADSDFDSDSDLETKDTDVVKIDLKLRRGDDIVKKLLEMWTPQGRPVKAEFKT
jgi:hypothetical protein